MTELSYILPANEESNEDTELFIGTVQINTVHQIQNDSIEILTFNDHHVEFKLDTGAKANIISKHVFDKLELNDSSLQKQRSNWSHTAELKSHPHVIKTLECAAKSLTCHFYSGCEYSSNSRKECMYRYWIHYARTLGEIGLVEGKPSEIV